MSRMPYRGHRPNVRRRNPLSDAQMGVVLVVLVIAGTFLAFTKHIPFTGHGYTLTATFANADKVRAKSPVRIAGVNVGQVLSVEPDGNAGKVTFTVDSAGQPVHTDAFVAIRPRIFLEGSYFLDLHPGSPSAPQLGAGGNIPITHTSTSVQFDEILNSLRAPERSDLGKLLIGYGTALTHKPTAAEDATQVPEAKGLSAAQAINHLFDYGGRAGEGSAETLQALTGSDPHDLSELIDSFGRFAGNVDQHEKQLQGLLDNFNSFTGALASQSRHLSQATKLLGPTVDTSYRSLVHLNETLPPLTRFSEQLRPAVAELPATFADATPWLQQAGPLLAPDALGSVANGLRVATPGLAGAAQAGIGAETELDQLSGCGVNTLIPVGNEVINDQFSNGEPNSHDFFYSTTDIAGQSGAFDGNGPYYRQQPGGGPIKTVADDVNGNLPTDKKLYANTISPPIGTQPELGGAPPKEPTAPCSLQAVPNVNGIYGGVGAPSPRQTP